MLAISLIKWWYTRGWITVFEDLKKRSRSILTEYSVTTLIKTLFSPWRRIVSLPGRSLQEKFFAAIDNLISRFIGFFVRLIVLIFAWLLVLIILIVSVIELIIWPLLPPAAVILLVIGVIKL